MAEEGTTFEERSEKYWWWFGAVLFLLLPIDMLTTMAATTRYGIEEESNPFVQWVLAQGLIPFTVVNLLAVLLVVCLFSILLTVVRKTPPPYDRYFERGVEVWLGLLLVTGLFVLLNNLTVIVQGRSLL